MLGHAALQRARMTASLADLGIPAIAETDVEEDEVLTSVGTAPAVVRIAAREDIVIAEAVRSILMTRPSSPD